MWFISIDVYYILLISNIYPYLTLLFLSMCRGADVDTRNNKDETPVESCVNKTGAVWTALSVNQKLRSLAARKLIRPEKLVER